jgi:23S rRNA pseudouridine1911/1915/1917 synthase
VHPGHGNYTGTLVNALAWYLKDDPTYDPNDPALGLVHRIDKDTSGLLVVAKKPEAKANLSMQFFHKTTKREYRALVWGIVRDDEGRIEGNIGRNPRDRMQMTVFPEGEDGGHPLFRPGASGLCHIGEMPPRDRTYASDTCPYEIYRAYAVQR